MRRRLGRQWAAESNFTRPANEGRRESGVETLDILTGLYNDKKAELCKDLSAVISDTHTHISFGPYNSGDEFFKCHNYFHIR